MIPSSSKTATIMIYFNTSRGNTMVVSSKSDLKIFVVESSDSRTTKVEGNVEIGKFTQSTSAAM